MIDLEIASLAVRLLIGGGQIAIVWYGISRMVNANRERAEASAQQYANQEKAAARRHRERAESSAQQYANQEKAAARRHDETMAALDIQRRAMEGLVKGMETVIERTAGKERTA